MEEGVAGRTYTTWTFPEQEFRDKLGLPPGADVVSIRVNFTDRSSVTVTGDRKSDAPRLEVGTSSMSVGGGGGQALEAKPSNIPRRGDQVEVWLTYWREMLSGNEWPAVNVMLLDYQRHADQAIPLSQEI